MADAFETLTKFIQSPPGQFAAGAALGGVVWKFFERVEAVLNNDTKLEIAVWLLDRPKLSPTFESWPDTFAKVFDRVFGLRHLSWRCFWRSSIASLGAVCFLLLLAKSRGVDIISLEKASGTFLPLLICCFVPGNMLLTMCRY